MNKKPAQKVPKRITLALAIIAFLVGGVFLFSFAAKNPKDTLTGLGAIPGDANGDGVVNVLDFQILSNSFGKSVGQAGYDPRANFNGDTTINVLDFQILSNNFGLTGGSNTPSPTPPAGGTSTPTPTTGATPTPPPGGGTIHWRGDAETGDISQWCMKHEFAPNRINIVTNPLIQGRNAYQFIYMNGDDTQGIQRATLLQEPCKWEVEGEDKYYGWSVYLPNDFPRSSLWTRHAQFKAFSIINPPIAFNIVNDMWQVAHYPTANAQEMNLWTGPIQKGQWDKWVMHVKWSSNPSIGFIEVWRNGTLVLPKRFTSTIFISNGTPVKNFVAIGIIRHPSSTTNMTVYHDGFTVGSTYSSVAQ